MGKARAASPTALIIGVRRLRREVPTCLAGGEMIYSAAALAKTVLNRRGKFILKGSSDGN